MKNTDGVATCKLVPTTDPAVFKSSPGVISFVLVSTSGNISFLTKNTDVLDQSGSSINPNKTPTTLSFTVIAGQTYVFMAEYFLFPSNSTGVLKEDCIAGTLISELNAMTNPQQFTIKG